MVSSLGLGLGVGCFGALGLVWLCCQFFVVDGGVLFGFGWWRINGIFDCCDCWVV